MTASQIPFCSCPQHAYQPRLQTQYFFFSIQLVRIVDSLRLFVEEKQLLESRDDLPIAYDKLKLPYGKLIISATWDLLVTKHTNEQKKVQSDSMAN